MCKNFLSIQRLAFLFVWWNPCQSAIMYKRYNWGSLSWIIGEVFPIPLVSKMSCQKLVDQHKEPNGVAHGVSPPKHGAVDTVDEDFHEKVGAGRVLEQVPLRYQVLVSDHSTQRERIHNLQTRNSEFGKVGVNHLSVVTTAHRREVIQN